MSLLVRETGLHSKRDIIQTRPPDLCFWLFSFVHFSILFCNFLSIPLISPTPKYVWELVPNRHEVLIAVTRGSHMLGIKDGFA